MQWPALLPQSLNVSGFRETFGDGALRQEMDAGPDYARPRYTAVTEPLQGQMIVSRSGYSILKDFYRIDTASGVLPFDWQHPITEAPARVQFIGPPQIVAESGLNFVVSIAIEVLP